MPSTEFFQNSVGFNLPTFFPINQTKKEDIKFSDNLIIPDFIRYRKSGKNQKGGSGGKIKKNKGKFGNVPNIKISIKKGKKNPLGKEV